MAPTVPPPMPYLGPTIGAIEIAILVSAVFYGVTLVQTFFYYRTFSQDRFALKALIGTLTLLDTFQTACLWDALWRFTIKDFGMPKNLNFMPWSFVADVEVSTLIAFIVQLYMCARVWTMSRNSWPLTIFLLICSVAAFVPGVIYGIRLGQLGLISKIPEVIYLIDTNLGATLATDILITGCLTWSLQRSRTGFKRTDSLIDALIVYSVTTGLLTSICALLDLIVHKIWDKTDVFFVFYFLLPKLYVNSLLATVNYRQHLREKDVPLGTTMKTSENTMLGGSSAARSGTYAMPVFAGTKTQVGTMGSVTGDDAFGTISKAEQ